jgi:NNP family nitrate/nitrite transporter-like MFS transporter
MGLREFARSGHPATLLLSFLYFDVSFAVWVLLGVLGVHVAGDFGLSPSQKGLMVALPMLGGALVRIPMGILVDRIGAKRTAILGQLLVAFPLLWGWLAAGTYSEVLGLGLFLGVAGGSFAVALPLASRWSPPEHQGLAMGVAGAGNSGTVLTALIAPSLADQLGWHATFGLALLPVALVFVLFVLFAKESPSRPAPYRLGAYLDVLKRPEALGFCTLYGFTFGGFVGLSSFLVVLFHDQYGFDRVASGRVAALCVFAGSLMRPVGGYLADRFGGARMLGLLLVVASAALGAFLLKPGAGKAVLLLCTALAALGTGNGSVFQLVPQRFRKHLGAATGTVGAAGCLGGFLLPNLMGGLLEKTGDGGLGFGVLGGIGLACLAVLFVLRRTWGSSEPPATLVDGQGA